VPNLTVFRDLPQAGSIEGRQHLLAAWVISIKITPVRLALFLNLEQLSTYVKYHTVFFLPAGRDPLCEFFPNGLAQQFCRPPVPLIPAAC
jgi:hypothetical protein